MGNTTKALLVFCAALVVVVGGRAIYSTLNPQDDKTLIHAALAESIKASREGRPGGVMDKLSNNISYNGTNEGANTREISRYIKESKPDIVVQDDNPTVTGDEAKIVSPVTLSVNILGQSMEKHLKEVTLIFRKEDDREWLIFPAKHWKLAEVQVPDGAASDLVQ